MQKKVNLYPAIGLPGQEVAVDTAVYTPINYVSDGTVAAGAFAFAGQAASGSAVPMPVASAKGTVLLGLVERTFTGMLMPAEDGTEVYPQGAEVTIARRGDFYVAATGAATVGKAVLCDPATGKVTYGDLGAANDTGWVVMTEAANEGDIIVISHRGVSVTPTKG